MLLLTPERQDAVTDHGESFTRSASAEWCFPLADGTDLLVRRQADYSSRANTRLAIKPSTVTRALLANKQATISILFTMTKGKTKEKKTHIK